ncbi:glycosyltransferase [bacterium]|nr:glycosyltransferase [bacterium]
MGSPTVSVVISTYNYGRFLAEAIDSVLAQTYKDYEIIVVDDGSTDNTREVVQPYTDLPNFIYHVKPNGGQPSALNKGIQLSRGRFIAFLDADDKWLPEKLERQMPLFEGRPQVGVVYCRRALFNEERVIGDHYSKPLRSGMVINWLLVDNFVPFASSIVRKECFEKAGPFDPKMKRCNDYDLWLRIALHYEFDFVDEPLHLYREGHVRMSSDGMAMIRGAFRVQRKFLRHCECPHMIKRSAVRAATSDKYWLLGRLYVEEGRKGKGRLAFLHALRYSPANLSPMKALIGSFMREDTVNALRKLRDKILRRCLARSGAKGGAAPSLGSERPR